MMKFLSPATRPADTVDPVVQPVCDGDADKENNVSDNMIEDTPSNSKKRSREDDADIIDLTPGPAKHQRTDTDIPTAAVEAADKPVELIDILNGQYQWHKQALTFADELSTELLEQYTQLMQSISYELTATHHADTVTGKRQRKQAPAADVALASTDKAVCAFVDVTCAAPRGRYSITFTLTHIILQPKTSTGQPVSYPIDVTNIALIQSRDMYIALTIKSEDVLMLKYNATAKWKSTECDVPHSDNTDVTVAQSAVKNTLNSASTQLQHQTASALLQKLTHVTTLETHDKSVFTSIASNKLTPSGVTCYCKTRDGVLHCYKSGLYFISTVPVCMPVQNITSVALNAATSSTVDVTVTMSDKQTYEFTQISKNESQRLDEYIAMMIKLIAKRAVAIGDGDTVENDADSDDSDASDSDFAESSDDSSSDVSEEFDSDIDGEQISSSGSSDDDNGSQGSNDDNAEDSDAQSEQSGDEAEVVDDSDDGVDIDRFVAE